MRGLWKPPRKLECTHWAHHVQTFFEPRHQRPGFQAPAGPASGPRLRQSRPGWRRGVGGRTGGLGPSALQARPQAVARERTAEAARGAPDSSPLSRAAGLHHPRIWLLSRPPSSKNFEPQNQPQTGGAAWGDGPGLGPVGARAGQALPLRAAGGQSAESARPRPFSVDHTPSLPLFSPSILPLSLLLPGDSKAQGPAVPTRPGWLTHRPAVRALVRVPTGRAECGAVERGRQCSESGPAHPGVWSEPPVRGAHPWAQGDAPRGSGRPSLLPASSTAASP